VRFDGAAWVATIGGELWSDQGGAGWAQAVLPGGAFAEHVERVGDELYLGGVDEIRVCTAGADPLLAASWGGAIRVGDSTGTITGLKAVGGVLFVFKTDGWYSLNADGSVNELAPEQRALAAAGNGANPVPFRDRLWVGYAGAYYQIDADGGYAASGPELLTENGSTVRGLPVSGAGHAGWFLYLGVYDATTNESNLLKYGTWRPGEDTSSAAFASVWHGSLVQWAGKQVTRLDVTYLGANPTLWVGFADGSVQWTALPADTPDPAQDSNCRFQTSGTVDWPDHHGMAQSDDKHWRRIAATGDIDAVNWVNVAYALDAGAYVLPGDRIESSGASFVPPDPLVGKVIHFREGYHGPGTSTPVVESVVLYEQVRTARLELEYACTAAASNRAVRLDGQVDRRSAEQIRAALRATAGPGPTTVWLPDGTRQDVDFVAYGEAIPNPDARYGVEWDVPLNLVQWRDTP
jgi:hypothetical protein